MSVNVPFRLFRYNAEKEGPPVLPGQSRELISRISCQPSLSTSRKAAPEPTVSGRYFFPNAPLLCRNLIPAAAVASTKCGIGAGVCAAGVPTARAPAASAAIENRSIRLVYCEQMKVISFRTVVAGVVALAGVALYGGWPAAPLGATQDP